MRNLNIPVGTNELKEKSHFLLKKKERKNQGGVVSEGWLQKFKYFGMAWI